MRWQDETVSERTQALIGALQEIAAGVGSTPAQVAIAWLLSRRSPELLPIVGVRSAEQLKDNLGALDVELSPDQLERLDEAAAPSLGFPRSFLESDGVRDLIYGETVFAR